MDVIKKNVELIRNKEEIPNFDDYLEKLKKMTGEPESEKPEPGVIQEKDQPENIILDKNQFKNKYKIEVNISTDSTFPAARAMVIHRKFSSAGSILNFYPHLEDVAKGIPCHFVAFDFLADLNQNEIEKILQEVSDIENYGVLSVPMEEEKKEKAVVAPLEAKQITSTLKIDSDVLDNIYNIVTELYILNEEFQEYKNQLPYPLLRTFTEFHFLITQLFNDISKIRLLPFGIVLSMLPRMIRDIALKEDKKVKFISKGEDILIDKAILEHLLDPLMHVVRNSVDHGIELPEERIKSGKLPEGIVSINAQRESGNLKVVILDDGKGIDIKKIKEVAMTKGIVPEQKVQQLTAEEVLSLITLPGFSTAAAVSEVSGRGYGMDIAKAKIESIGGTIKIETKAGIGTKITIYIPLTVSIVDTFIVSVNGNTFAIPMSPIVKTMYLQKMKYIMCNLSLA